MCVRVYNRAADTEWEKAARPPAASRVALCTRDKQERSRFSPLGMGFYARRQMSCHRGSIDLSPGTTSAPPRRPAGFLPRGKGIAIGISVARNGRVDGGVSRIANGRQEANFEISTERRSSIVSSTSAQRPAYP